MSTPVTVWVVRPTAHVEVACLSPAERDAAATLGTPAGRRRHLRSRAVLRHVVAAASGTAPADVPLVAPPGAPPQVAGSAAPAVSLSHAAGTIAAAVRGSGAVGIDVEVARSRHRPVPSPVLSDRRMAVVADLVQAASGPLAVWVLLEAALKAAGTGFSIPQQQVGFTRVPGGVVLDVPGHGPHVGIVRELPGDAVLAVATPGTHPAVQVLDPGEPHSSIVSVAWSPAS